MNHLICTIELTSAKQRSSSCSFSLRFSCNGYLYSGNLAIGQSNAGTSNLCTYLECVVDKTPSVRPWNEPLNDSIDSWGAPGGMLIMHDSFSKSVKSEVPPLLSRWYFMNIFLYAFSLEQDPHIIVVSASMPLGATYILNIYMYI